MKLALVIGSLGGGGAERVMSVLANAWAARGDDVTIITVDVAGSDRYSLNPAVKRVSLGLKHPSRHWWQGLANNVQRVRALRAALRTLKPDGVLSFLTSTNVLSVLAARPLGIPAVVSERTAADRPVPAVWRLLQKLAYRKAAALVVQTRRGLRAWNERIPTDLLHVIPNPVCVDGDQTSDSNAAHVMDDCGDDNILMALGRLSREKGFDLLLQAFARVSTEHPGWRLLILGEGPECGRLEALMQEFGIADRVLMPGFTSTPHTVMRRAHLFVLSSRYEGFPNALLEAMACGLPCVSFDCPTGPAEMIEHERNGVLVPPENVEALAQAVACLMEDSPQRQRLGNAARDSANEYSLESILAQWQSLFETCGMCRQADRA